MINITFEPPEFKRLVYVDRIYCRTTHTKVDVNTSDFNTEKIRNFSIIAHIDHGKSTLADRLLEYTGTIPKSKSNKQVLDKLQVERERGITVKAQTSSMIYKNVLNNGEYLLNLIDTPGHVDFSYEVSRSLAACQGALLVVDAAQGVQAQTVANYFNAVDAGLTILPVINKIDLSSANVSKVSNEIVNVFGFTESNILKVSAKEGIGMQELLETVCSEVPSPPSCRTEPLSLFLFDSWYDTYRGVICLVAVRNGVIRKDDIIESFHSKERFEVNDIGILHPNEVRTNVLHAGQVGYIVMGMRDVKQALIGDTFYHVGIPVKGASGFKQPTPMVFGGVYPPDQAAYTNLNRAIQKLTLNDSSVQVHPDNSAALGQGWRIGFLGLLHMDVFQQRLTQEYNAEVIMTTPNVPYEALLKGKDTNIRIRSPEDFPERIDTETYFEPMVIGTLIFPDKYIGKIIALCEFKRGEQISLSYIDDTRILLKYKLPLNEIVVDFYDQLKSISSGFASCLQYHFFDYEENGFVETEIEKLEILLNGKSVDALSTIVHKSKAKDVGKSYCFKLKNSIPRQLFEVVIQAAVRRKVIARETVNAIRKDVTAKCYGGDITRKRKLLERQKEGKKKMKKFGNVDVPHEVFLSLLKK